MHIEIIFQQIIILIILVLVGIMGSKAGVISENSKDGLARIIFNITLPLMLLCNFSRLDITPRLLSNSLTVIALSFLTLLFMLFVSWVTTRFIKMTDGESAIFTTHSVFGNLVYLGFPLIYALFGNEGLLYAAMFQLVSNILMWTVGVMILNPGKSKPLMLNIINIFNINTIAIVIGFILFLCAIKLPPVILGSLGELGDTTAYLSMLYIGSMMYYSDLRGALNNKEVYVLTANKLLVIPLLLILIFSLIFHFYPGLIDVNVVSVLVIMSAMPAMANVVIMAKIYGADDKLAAVNVFVSTIISLITLPLILLCLNRIPH